MHSTSQCLWFSRDHLSREISLSSKTQAFWIDTAADRQTGRRVQAPAQKSLPYKVNSGLEVPGYLEKSVFFDVGIFYIRSLSFCLVSIFHKKKKKRNMDRSGNELFIQAVTNLQISIDFQSNSRPSRKPPCEKSHILAVDEAESNLIRSVFLRKMTSLLSQKKSRRSK